MPEHVDENGETFWTYVTYVVELDKRACTAPKSPCGDPSCAATPVYVGQTARTAAIRFEQHRNGCRASKWVRRFGLHLRPRLAGRDELATKEEALIAEGALGERLSRRGYCVYGAH